MTMRPWPCSNGLHAQCTRYKQGILRIVQQNKSLNMGKITHRERYPLHVYLQVWATIKNRFLRWNVKKELLMCTSNSMAMWHVSIFLEIITPEFWSFLRAQLLIIVKFIIKYFLRLFMFCKTPGYFLCFLVIGVLMFFKLKIKHSASLEWILYSLKAFWCADH